MKNSLFSLFLSIVFTTGFSQDPAFELSSRLNRTIKKDKLDNAMFNSKMVPGFWENRGLPYEARNELNLRKKMDYGQRFSMVPQDFEYNKILEIVSAEITTTNLGKEITIEGKSDLLTLEQKTLIDQADLGADIWLKVRFKYKDQPSASEASKNKIIINSYKRRIIISTTRCTDCFYRDCTRCSSITFP